MNIDKYGIKIKHCRGNNVRFNKETCVGNYKKRKEVFNYCGVGAHHQNEATETKNKTLPYGFKTLLLCTKGIWPGILKYVLWSYVLLATAKKCNELALNKDRKPPL